MIENYAELQDALYFLL